MKYAIVIPDGAADEPQEALGGKTPLEAAHTPNMDRVVAMGVIARACHTPQALPAGSEIGNLSLLGYNPFENFTGRAPMEAAAQGIQLGPVDWAVRCNLVTVEDQVMRDFTADHITTEEGAKLLASAQERIASDPKYRGALEFVTGVSYRNLLLWRGAKLPCPFTNETRTRAPHDITDQSVLEDYPRGPGSDVLCDLMDASVGVFQGHPVNSARQAAGKRPASNVWLWGLGQAPRLKPFVDEYGPRGAMITAADLLPGIGATLGWGRVLGSGARGDLDTHYAPKGRGGGAAIKKNDIVSVPIP